MLLPVTFMHYWRTSSTMSVTLAFPLFAVPQSIATSLTSMTGLSLQTSCRHRFQFDHNDSIFYYKVILYMTFNTFLSGRKQLYRLHIICYAKHSYILTLCLSQSTLVPSSKQLSLLDMHVLSVHHSI